MFPWVIGITGISVVAWLIFVFNLDHAFLAFFLSAIFILPGIAFALVNAWSFDRSRKDVHFAYRISGRGANAFSQVNQALQSISNSGQTLLFVGRRHFEDTRYSGGAESLPEFKHIECSQGKPPLLELDFDVWHMRAFNRDLYFMPDHVLVYDGANMGGVNYANLEVSAETEVAQARDLATPTRDAKIVGKTYRFVNKDGSPDQRFNSNRDIPLIEYGVLKFRGAGLDLSLFVTNQKSAFDVPDELAEIRDLARKPVCRIAEQRRSEAAARRKARQVEVFAVVLDALSCIMFADGQASKLERAKIQQLMQRIRAPWDEEEVDSRMRDFRNRAASEGLKSIVDDVCRRASAIKDPRQKTALCRCVDQVMSADGEIHAKETAIRNQIVEAIEKD
ncbi:MAG: TerB family tellurite resistance protein [Planctomycetaceae bacterium]|nr:TerB family tellurite resistance protein [Planctomycetaceae bacterium]